MDENQDGQDTPPEHRPTKWNERHDFMHYFAKEKPWVKLSALCILKFATPISACIVWYVTR